MIKLTNDKIAVTPIDDPSMTKGGLYIPDMAKERCDQGIVKYIGPEVKDITIGMYILYSGYTGELVHVEGEGRIIIFPEKFAVCELVEPANVDVPGLYFKGRINKIAQQQELASFIKTILQYHRIEERVDEIAISISEELCKNGVYGPVANPYFQADYEHAMEFISMAFQESDWYRGIKVKMQRPKYNEKNEMEPV